MPLQPTPEVTGQDVGRVVRRDFPKEQHGEVMVMLDEYGVERWHPERYRVQLAALKLANGNLKRLRYAIEDAKRDYRNVVAPAEYPSYLKETSIASRPGPDARAMQGIFDEDLAPYEDWLKK
jgi:hypothetical protein